MEELIRKLEEFRKLKPKSGSEIMKSLIQGIIAEYDSLENIKLPFDDRERLRILSVLYGVAIIRRRFFGGDDLSLSCFLFGLSPLDDNYPI